MKNIVMMGGGTGTYTVLSGLKEFTSNLTAIVTMADSGGSTGRLRDEQGVLPPGDIRRALVALSNSNEMTRKLFTYRFEGDRFGEGGVGGHTVGNLLIAALEKITGSFEEAVAEAGRMLDVAGQVVPVTTMDTHVVATLDDGTSIKGEGNLWQGPRKDFKIKGLKLEPAAKATEHAVRSLAEANLIVLGPGALFSSLIPLLLVEGIPEAIRDSKAKKVYVANLMTEYPVTDGYGLLDFVDCIERYLGRGVLDYVVFNNRQPSPAMAKKYASERSYPVKVDAEKVAARSWMPIPADIGSAHDYWRHDSEKLAQLLLTVSELENVLKFVGKN